MNDRGEMGFRLGDFKAEDNYKSNGVGIAKKEQTVASSADKRKAVAKPSAKPTTEPKVTKKGSKRKAAAATEQLPLRIYHKNKGRSERIFNQKMKKSRFGPNGEGSTPDKALFELAL
ncbi:hypothetical protein Tco_0365471 [Tanacetum coccineum]